MRKLRIRCPPRDDEVLTLKTREIRDIMNKYDRPVIENNEELILEIGGETDKTKI